TYHGLASREKAERQWRAVQGRVGGGSPEALMATVELAHVLCHRGRLDAEVLEMARSASEGLARILRPDHPDTLEARNYRAQACLGAGRVDEAIARGKDTLRLCAAKLGHDHRITLESGSNLALAYLEAGRPTEAIPLLEEDLGGVTRSLGLDHPNTLQ